jgi:hypothetical protein
MEPSHRAIGQAILPRYGRARPGTRYNLLARPQRLGPAVVLAWAIPGLHRRGLPNSCDPYSALAWVHFELGEGEKSQSIVRLARARRHWIAPGVLERLKKTS